MTIHIEELTFKCIIGILDFERISPQTVIINAQITYNYTDKFFINYADIIQFIEKDMIQNKYQLLETTINELAHKIKSEYVEIEKLHLKITKADIIDNAKVSLSKSF
ncbi:MAG TPA: FolB domain-containing protein [Campylobacterales bacterium]|nr:FolB domain-containing protein [Campylobacterales bacterium]